MLTNTTRQVIKFSLTGGLNTFVDFAVLNVLIVMFGLGEQDPKYTLFKLASAGAAIINSYFINKFWVFRKQHPNEKDKKELASEAVKFIGVSVIGAFINAGIASLVFAGAHTILPEVSTHLLANIGAAVGIVVVMVTNFIGYKFFVFKK